MSVEKRFKKLLFTLDISAAKLAKKIGVSPPSISRIMTGDSYPGHKVLEQLLLQYNVDINWILAGKGTMFIGSEIPVESTKDKKVKISKKDFESEIALLKQEVEHLKVRLKDKEDIIELLKK